MIKIVAAFMPFILAAGMCGGGEKEEGSAEKPAQQSESVEPGDPGHPNVKLRNMKNQMQKQSDDRTKKLDEKIENSY